MILLLSTYKIVHLQKAMKSSNYLFLRIKSVLPNRADLSVLCGMTFASSHSLKRHVARCVTTWSGSSQQSELQSDNDQETSKQYQSSSNDVEVLVPAIDAMEPMNMDDIETEQMDSGGPSTNEGAGVLENISVETSEHLDQTYYYLCLDCERDRISGCGNDCSHVDHPRFPITMDLAGHFIKTGHSLPTYKTIFIASSKYFL